MKMNFTCEHYGWDNFTGEQLEPISKISFETKNESLPEILEDFEMFLRGCGYYFDGHLDIIDEDYMEPIQESSGCGNNCEGCVCESAEKSSGWNSVIHSLNNPPTFRAADLTGKNS